MDRIDIGPTPSEENCAQLGTENYAVRAQMECNAYRNQIKRLYGVPPEGASLVIAGNSHDIGTYYEVAVKYNGRDEAATDYAFSVENDDKGVLSKWDNEARDELRAAGVLQETAGSC